jgi:Zn-dependent peptidase ImmA (M78 family)
MDQLERYDELKALAREVREKYGVSTSSFGLREMRSIYRQEGIHIDMWRRKLRKVQAAYLIVGGVPHVMLNAAVKPAEPRLFSMAHELKHHYADQELAESGVLGCVGEQGIANLPEIEIGAGVFAAEFLFPEAECLTWMEEALGAPPCDKEGVVRLKRCCPAKVSYAFLLKRIYRFGYADKGAFEGTQFRKLEDSIYGVPFYRRRARL